MYATACVCNCVKGKRGKKCIFVDFFLLIFFNEEVQKKKREIFFYSGIWFLCGGM